jgi:hypothetical protein
MDIAENGIPAQADRIEIRVHENKVQNRLVIMIRDNGRGIPPEMLARITDPFVTSRTTRRVGMGLSLLKAAAERCEGTFSIFSEPGKGTQVTAEFQYDHIDRAPLGDMVGSITLLIAGNPQVNFVYTHMWNTEEFVLDTAEIKAELGDIPISDPSVIKYLKQTISEALDRMRSAAPE